MIAMIESKGANIRVIGRANGGYEIKQGDRYVLFTRHELSELGTVIGDVLSGNEPAPKKRYRMA